MSIYQNLVNSSHDLEVLDGEKNKPSHDSGGNC